MMQNSTSGDVFCEYMVKRRKGMTEIILQSLFIAVGAFLTLMCMMIAPAFFAIFIVIWIAVYFGIRMLKVEFEYAFTSGDLDIDKLTGNLRRKRKMTINMNSVEIVAPKGSHELDSYAHGRYAVKDFSAHNPKLKDYIIICQSDNDQIKVIFTPNDRMIDAMFSYSPRKVKKD